MRNLAFAAWRRVVILGAPLFVAAAADAQTPCPASEQVGWLGIDGIMCTNCRFMQGRSRFSTEPRITAVAAGSPGVGVIRPGDVIVSINGVLITTEEGASRFSNLKPGQNVTLLVRREGELVTARFNNLPAHCPTVSEARVLPTPAVPGGRAGVAAGPTRPSRAPGARVGGGGGVFGAEYARAGRPLMQGPARVSRVVFGFGIACEDCSMRLEGVDRDATMIWVFRSPPVLYSVETDGPAWRAGLRRGDVITHIDGIEVTRDEAGRRFGAVQPGQTVRFTYRRDNDSRTAPITAVAPAGIVALAGRPAPTQQTEVALRRMRELLTEINAKEREEQALVERMRQTGDERLAATIEKYRAEQADQVRKLRELQAQLAVTEVGVREIMPTRAPGGRGEANPNTIRYSGEIGNVDIEIRGGRPVVVEESPDEIIIRTGESEIRLKRRTPR